LGASVLPSIGGLSESEVSDRRFEIPYPPARTFLTVGRIRTRAEGTVDGAGYRTETEAEIESIAFLDKLRIDRVRFHMLSVRDRIDAEPQLSTTGNRIEGVHLGGATVRVELDDTLLPWFATGKQIERNFGPYTGNQIQNVGGTYYFNIVKSLEVMDRDKESNLIEQVAPNALRWAGFGTIFFGELIVKNDDRQVIMVRLEMGYDVGGSGTVGDGHSNGSAGSN